MAHAVLVALVAAALFAAPAVAAYDGIGDQLAHTFLKFDQLPMTASAAQSVGWSAVGSCDPMVGIEYQNSAPTDYHPISLFFTDAGQIAGWALTVSGDQPPHLVPDYWVPNSDTTHKIFLTTRSANLCNGATFPEPLGDSVIINKQTTGFEVPITLAGAQNGGWAKGGCIGGMGTHWSYDTVYAPKLTYNASTLLPVTAMYESDTQAIGAVLIQTSTVQEHVPVVGDWEGPFPPSLLCYNYCDNTACEAGFDASTSWPHLTNTMHFLFRPHSLNKCAAHCS